MTTNTETRWEAKRTEETRMVEERLSAHFHQVDAYRYNSASIRVRVIDPRFEGMKREQRDAMVEAELEKLPPETQSDIVMLYTFAPSELTQTPNYSREVVQNMDFADPTQSML